MPTTLSISDGIKQYTIQNLHPDVASTFDLPGSLPPLVEFDLGRFLPSLTRENVAGRSCSVYEDRGAKRWLWNHLILKEIRESTKQERRSEKKAVDVQENIPLSPDLFILSPNIKPVPMQEYLGYIRKTTAK